MTITTSAPNPAFARPMSVAKVLGRPATQAGAERIRVGVIGRWYLASLDLDASSVHAA